MGEEIVIQFHPDGRRFAVHTEEIPLAQLGRLTAKRASQVEFNGDTQKWEVTLEGESAPRFSHASRKECIRWEIAHIQSRMTEIVLRHFPN